MILYGTPLDDDENERTTCLRNVTVAASSAELRQLARFLSEMAEEIDEFGSGFDHDHYALFVGRGTSAKYWGGDVTVVNPTHVERDDLGDARLARMPPLVRAARLGDEAAVADLLASGHGVDAADPGGWTALLAACEASAIGIVERLLAAGANVEAGSDGYTPLLCAANHGSVAIFDRLLAAGANIHAETDGPTPYSVLDYAAGGGHVEIVQRALERGVLQRPGMTS